jgi:nuclear pore complex protein Nup188
MALASIPSAAERLASEGVLLAYGENTISNAIRSGSIDVTIPELPGDRSPAHKAYCSMLAIVSGVTSALGRQTHFDNEVSGFVQLYGDQLSRALSWSIGDPLTLPYLEELEQVVNLFAAIARNLPLMTRPGESVTRILRVFTTHALTLLQHLNYALTHPNHLASLLEPITAAERELIEKDRKSSFQSSSEIVDPMKRPFLTRLIHRLFKLTNGIIGALTDISGAERVLIGEQQDWLLHEALVVPVRIFTPSTLSSTNVHFVHPAFKGGGWRTSLVRDFIGARKLHVGHPAPFNRPPPRSDNHPCGRQSHHRVRKTPGCP